ncbi:penicillin-binding protein activator LpoB [Acinetobacter defluvii]|uniref:CsgG/HfaB family protein n=1 Tax=Acinetobacter defluvii TaxID=1871111 RepID=UPI00148FA61C|nr:penicillin-binding protein activator LpoB [Acinetobacter defluvii]
MKKIVFSALLAVGVCSSAFAALKEVVKEASGSGATQHQAISEALLVAVQSVNGATVSPRADLEETVNMSMSGNNWNYSGKVSPVFSVDSVGSGSVTKFQVLSVSGSKNNYRARVRAHVVQYQSTVQDQHLRRIAVLPFQFYEKNNRSVQADSAGEFSEELADALGNYLAQSGQLSLLDRHYIDEMQYENAFLQWDGAPHEMARIGQKVGADYLLVGRINDLSAASSQHMYGLNQGAEQVRLTWRVIEANTSKVVASGTFNRALPKNSVQNLLNNTLDNSSAETLAQNLSQEILVGLKLQPNANYGSQGSNFTPTYDMTPGSSEKPIKW